MDLGDSILDTIHEELSSEDGEDVEMMDVEEGEFVKGMNTGQIGEANDNEVKTESHCGNPQNTKKMNKRKKKKKKKNRKKKAVPESHPVNIDRFVLDVCKRLKEKKSYLVYTAVGVLGISALSDLVKEVYAIQACGGQKTANGDRLRTGGGILWNILKARDPNAYKEIMKKGKDFEKQFRQPRAVQPPVQNTDTSQSTVVDAISSRETTASISDDDFETKTLAQEQPAEPSTGEKRRPVHERIRVPVSYDDLPVEEPPKDQLS